MPATYEPIASTTLGSGVSTTTFSDIPGTYTDLRVVFIGSSSSSASNIGVRFNSDTSSIYSRTWLAGSDSAASSGRVSNGSYNELFYSNAANGRTVAILDVFSYASTSVFKTSLASQATTTLVQRYVNLWRSTDAITSITIFTNAASSSFESGTVLSLYGIKAA